MYPAAMTIMFIFKVRLKMTGRDLMNVLMSMISLFILRTKEPNLERPFSSPFYPVFPAVALVISAVAMLAIIYYHLVVSLIFFAGLIFSIAVFMLMGKHKVKLVEDNMIAPVVL